MEVYSESDTDPLSEDDDTYLSDAESFRVLDDSDFEPSSDEDEVQEHDTIASSSDSSEILSAPSTRSAVHPLSVSSSDNSQTNSQEPQRAEAATLASEVALVSASGSGSEQSITREPNIANEPLCSTSSTRNRAQQALSPSRPKDESMTSEDDSMMCPICFEMWTTSGTHRLVSLKCGHLFGLACIEKWITQPKAKCPQCNHLAKKSDIRKVYARSLKVLDTSERDQALQDLASEQQKRRRAEVETASVRMKLELVTQQCESLKKELIEHQKISKKRLLDEGIYEPPCTNLAEPAAKLCFVLEKTLNLSKEGGCRILAVSSMLPLIVTSQPSSNPLFPAYGFKKINTMDFGQKEFVPIHQKPIKDMAFHTFDSLVLSTAQDKTVKITNVYSNSVVQNYNLDVDAWSCIWNRDDLRTFFVGLQNGQVLQFDTRMTSTYVCQLPVTGKNLPVVSLQYLEKAQAASNGMCGPISLQLSECTFFEQRNASEFRVHPLPVEGRFTSMSIEPATGHMLLSCRPSTLHPKVTHLLCELTFKNMSQEASVIDKCCSCNIVQSFEGGPFQAQLTRSRLFLNPANSSSVLVCSGDENSRSVMIWDASTSKCISHLSTNAPVLDLCGFRSISGFCLGALTDRQLKIYRWNDP